MSASTETPKTIYRKDYTPPDYLVDTVDLRFELGEQSTLVHARLTLRRNHEGERPLVLDGQELELKSIALDGRELGEGDYRLSDDQLTIDKVPDRFELATVTAINPQHNTSLEGLYQSSGNFCTQCEAEGFRKITYFLDRPDVMARYTTTVVADKARYPVLLSNGNPVARGALDDGRHWVTWEDPFPKPSYLFALVAGDLGVVEDRFVTLSGREVLLQIYVEHHNLDKCEHAMASLKRAMKWDEERFGREYDLDIYMIVAVDDFNMGAMENKGLNVFNSKYVLARPDTATDDDYEGIESVIGHEYFHNWSGNRITCRDWFQLSLKEGFTVFRDEEFTADMRSRAVKRIKDVSVLRTHQFTEDAGPMAHPVRPDSYVEINNFYTMTVYNKGAEVVRMQHTLLGEDAFRRGCDLYFERHDGQAVTVDDFVAAMETSSGRDLSQFKHWYSQSGTPQLMVTDAYDAQTARYTLTLRQSTPPTPGQPEKQPFHMPMRMGLLDNEGQEIPLRLEGEAEPVGTERVLELTETEQSFTFVDVPGRPVPSLLRGFSAPVKLEYDFSDTQLAFLMAHDSDSFNRWEAGQILASRVILGLVADLQSGREPVMDEHLLDAYARLLAADTDPALQAEALKLPGELYLAEQMQTVDVEAIHQAREFVRRELATALQENLLARYRELGEEETVSRPGEAAARRSLRHVCLGYLMAMDDPVMHALCHAQYEAADNMTDSLTALTQLVHAGVDGHQEVLADFHQRWRKEPLVMDKWFAVQATSPQPGVLRRVRELLRQPEFEIRNPNKVRALIGSFARLNPLHFHSADGQGYRFVAEQVMHIDDLNPQVAARLVSAFNAWRRYDERRQMLVKEQLQLILEKPGLSRDVYEIASKALKG